jgi:glycosyltransferase involved in cell wall biosynthesis
VRIVKIFKTIAALTNGRKLTRQRATEQMNNLLVSVLIPTYKRAHLLDHVLAGLANQTYKHFEVLVVAKPSGDKTEATVEKYAKTLKIRLLQQTQGYMLDAVNIGLKNAKGQIILFLDDDVIPFPNLIQAHVESYSLSNLGGVAGDVLRASIEDRDLGEFKPKPSDLLPSKSSISAAARIGMKLWNKPLQGQESCLFYISKAGVVSMNSRAADVPNLGLTKSLLGRGANMSVLAATVEGFRFPSSWILGFTYEQYLAWHIWKKGYSQIFNPEIKVYHLEHGQSLSRNFQGAKRETLLYTEQKLLFYRLYGKEPQLSLLHRAVWLGFETLIDIKRICLNRELHRTAGLKSTFYSVVIGFKWSLQKRFGLAYSPLSDLEKLRR